MAGHAEHAPEQLLAAVPLTSNNVHGHYT